VFAALLVVQMWAAHAVAFFAHEYAHSFAAWLLGWKANPLAINYAHPSLPVFLLQRGMSEKVDYDPIFAGGHGVQAGMIAAAGMVIGNWLITFPLSRWCFSRAKRRGSRVGAMLAYWVCMASVGNFIDYVPVRTFTTEDDMGTLQRGFGWSPWTVMIVLGIPTAVALVEFLFRFEPRALAWLFPDSRAKRVTIVSFTAVWLFCFYGSSGWSGGGPISHAISGVSIRVICPLMAIVGIVLVARNSRDAAAD